MRVETGSRYIVGMHRAVEAVGDTDHDIPKAGVHPLLPEFPGPAPATTALRLYPLLYSSFPLIYLY